MAAFMSETESSLSRVLEQKLLYTAFQPIVSLQERRIYAWEALSRCPEGSYWHNRTAEMFSDARKQGCLVELENLSRERAIEGFSAQRLPGYLFLNISPELLVQPGHTPGKTLALLNRYGLSADRVVIELTEQQPVHDFELMRKAISHYRAMGFRIALDDLGSGYSGLRLWSELRPDVVKIDRHFVHQVHADPVNQEFVRFMFNVANKLGTQVIAEGVETRSELEMLQKLGATHLQGYYFARPQQYPKPGLDRSLFYQPLKQRSAVRQQQYMMRSYMA